MRIALLPPGRRLRRRLWILTLGLVGAGVIASSCSLDAAVDTDRSGHVTGVNALRIESAALDMAVALIVRGGELMIELRWRRDPPETARAL